MVCWSPYCSLRQLMICVWVIWSCKANRRPVCVSCPLPCPLLKLHQGHDGFFDGEPTVTDDGLSRVYECVTATGHQGEIICWQPHWLLLVGKREGPGDLGSEFRRGVNTNPLATEYGQGPANKAASVLSTGSVPSPTRSVVPPARIPYIAR